MRNKICAVVLPRGYSTCCYTIKNGLYQLKIIEANTNPEVVIKENDIEIFENKKTSIVVK